MTRKELTDNLSFLSAVKMLESLAATGMLTNAEKEKVRVELERLLRPTVACMYNYVQPIVATIISVCFGMDTFGPMKFVAVFLVFLGVFMVTQSKSREQMEKEALLKQESSTE